jgi:protein-S-isoprenylcysteine O-methyltransferase Ste14
MDDPLALHNWVATTLVFGPPVVDVLVEGRHFRGDRARRRGDRTYFILEAVQIAGLVLGVVLAENVSAADLPGRWLWPAIGCGLGVAGVAMRLWAIRTLGPLFTRYVEVSDDHRVVTDGPYRYLRHPSYTGALLMFAGVGVGLGNALSIAVVIGLPLIGYLVRIAREEALLREKLGEPYAAYAARTRRLVPGVW